MVSGLHRQDETGVHEDRGSWKQADFTRRIVVGRFHRQDEMGVHAEGLGSRLISQGGLW